MSHPFMTRLIMALHIFLFIVVFELPWFLEKDSRVISYCLYSFVFQLPEILCFYSHIAFHLFRRKKYHLRILIWERVGRNLFGLFKCVSELTCFHIQNTFTSGENYMSTSSHKYAPLLEV